MSDELRMSALRRQFDAEARALVQRMLDAGWTGRLNHGQHAVMKPPDGGVIVVVSRSSLRGRSGRNARAAFARWERGRP